MNYCENCGELHEFDECPACGEANREVKEKKEELAKAEEKTKPKKQIRNYPAKVEDQPEPEQPDHVRPITAKLLKKLIKKSTRVMVRVYPDDGTTWVSNGHWLVVAPTDQWTSPIVQNNEVISFKENKDSEYGGTNTPDMKAAIKVNQSHPMRQEYQHGMMVKLRADGTDRYLYSDGTRHTTVNADYVDQLAALVEMSVKDLPVPYQDVELGPMVFDLGSKKLVVMPMRLD